MRRSLGATLLLALCACTADPPSPSAPVPPSAAPAGAALEAAPSPAAPRSAAPLPSAPPVPQPLCVRPLPDAAPPPASPAFICPTEPDVAAPLPEARIRFREAGPAAQLHVELAVTADSRTRGLMYRKSLADGAGMLFAWPNEAPRAFWMHNTCIPLDMLFIDAHGFVAGIVEQAHPMTDTPRSVPCPAAYVLETVPGWARAHGVKPGQRMSIDRPLPSPEM